MTPQEFSNQFDILYNNASNSAPGLDEYEKSVILTKAEKELVRDYFNSKTVKTGEGFDDSQKRQYDFSTLLSTVKLNDVSLMVGVFRQSNSSITNTSYGYPDVNSFDDRSMLFLAPPDLFLSINESIKDSNNRRYSVLPISYDEYNRLMLKPYGYPLKRQAWRMISDRSSLLGEYKIYTKPPYTPLYRSRSIQDLYVTIQKSDTKSQAPRIQAKGNVIHITFTVKKGEMQNYWNQYLESEDKIKAAGLSPYLYPFDQGGNGIWSTADITGTSLTMYIPSYKTPTGDSVSIPIFEVIGRFPDYNIEYTMRYVRTPKPIILTDLDTVQEGLSIDGYNKITECELPVNTHEEILQRAVEIAKATYQGDLNSIIQTGNVSGTELGYSAKQG